MRRLTYFIASTIDGFIAHKDVTFDFFPMTGEHIPYIVAEFPETIAGHLRDAFEVKTCKSTCGGRPRTATTLSLFSTRKGTLRESYHSSPSLETQCVFVLSINTAILCLISCRYPSSSKNYNRFVER